ncbi:hypothetical protein B9Z19DRAFT_1133869 [Tuber borchii]|uniref:Uncharacterized protein n=1 Tax=Tuber borchii TaxID=42251 RepID=A0A2T6ZF41_TUBBO|nr:hypothetical protein B9Z19DRAFT_1133869 [Tuber borchii]
MSKRKKVEMAARRVACDEVPDQEYPLEDYIPSSDRSTPVPTMDDNRWEQLINKERPINADMSRHTIPQALKELMSERLLIDDYNGKLHYFWAYMFFYHWHFSEEERCEMFKKIEPSGFLTPQWIQNPDSLRGWFDRVYNKFTVWIWEKVKLYGEMYLKSEEGTHWETNFNKASENSGKKSKPEIMNGILFGILELQEVFSPLLEICERTKSRFGCGYWISESNNGSWWAERLKQKFIQAVAIYVVGQTEAPGSQTDRLMIEALRKCSPLPPPRQGIRPPAMSPGEMNWPSMDRPFDELEAFNFVGLLEESGPCSTSENNEYLSTLPSQVLDEEAPEELRSTYSHKAALSINSTLPEESGDTDVQSSETITAPLQPDYLSKILNYIISTKNREGVTKEVKKLRGNAPESLAGQSIKKSVEEMYTQSPKEVEEKPSSSPEDRLIWLMSTSGGTQPTQTIDKEEMEEEVADNLSGNKSECSYGSTRTSVDTYYGPEVIALHNRLREMARNREEVEKHKSHGNDQSNGNLKEKAREPEAWFPSSAGRKHEQQKKSVNQRGGELPSEGRARRQAEAISNLDWFPALSGTPLLPNNGRAKEQVEATPGLAGGRGFPAPSGSSHLAKEGRTKEWVEATFSLAGGRGFPAPSGPSDLAKEGRAKEQVEATPGLAGRRGFPAPSGSSHLAKEGRAKEQVEATSSLARGRGFPAPSGPSHLAKNGKAKEQVEAISSLAGGRGFPAPSGPSHSAKEGRAKEQVEATPGLAGGRGFPAQSGPAHLAKEGRDKEQVEATSTGLAGASNFPDRPDPSHTVPQAQQAIEGLKFAHNRRSAGRTENNQRPFPFFNPDIDPVTGLDVTHKNQKFKDRQYY